MRTLRVSAVAAVLASVVGYAQQGAQQAAPADAAGSSQPQAPTPVIRTQANLVLLDVVVRNKDGAVHGLTGDKFHVLDNGVAQRVTVEEHTAPDAATLAKLAHPAANLGAGVYTDLPDAPAGSAVNVLLLDALNTPLTDQLYVRKQMLAYLKTIPPGTRIAVFTLTAKLRMVSGFTTDAEQIAQSLTGPGEAQHSVVLGSGFGEKLGDVVGKDATPADTQVDRQNMLQFKADETSFQTDLRVETTLEALQLLARYLGGIEGRKNLIWFSSAFPTVIFPDPTLVRPFEAVRSYAEDIQLTDGMLSAARVAVYPVDASGLVTPPSGQASTSYANTTTITPQTKAQTRGAQAAQARAMQNRMQADAQAPVKADAAFEKQTELVHDAMKQVAEETGGVAFLDGNGIKEAVGQAVANGANYYTVGYVPALDGDKNFHRVSLSVDGQSDIQYRRSYNTEQTKTKTPPTVEERLIAAAGQQGAPPLSEVLFKVHVAAVDIAAAPTGSIKPVADASLKRYAIDYGLLAKEVHFTADGDGIRHGQVEFVAIAYSSEGKKVNVVDQKANLDLKPAVYDQLLHSGIPMHQEINLPVGANFLRIVVHDLSTDRVGAIEVPVTVAQ